MASTKAKPLKRQTSSARLQIRLYSTLVLVISTLLLSACEDLRKTVETPVTSYQMKEINAPVFDHCSTPSQNCPMVKLSYPEFQDAISDEILVALNQHVEKWLLKSPFSGQARPNHPEQLVEKFQQEATNSNQTHHWELERTVTILYVDKSLITLKFTEHRQLGEPNATSSIALKSLDLSDSTPLMLSEILVPGFEGPLAVELERSWQSTINRNGQDAIQNISNIQTLDATALLPQFGILGDALLFYHHPKNRRLGYDPIALTVPFSEIQNLIRENGPVEIKKQ